MEPRTLFAVPGEQLSLLDFAFGNPEPAKRLPVRDLTAPMTAAAAGQYLIRSESERGFWCNDFGWVFQRDAATGFSSVQASAAQIAKWHPRGAKGMKKDKKVWYWVARPGGLGGHRGGDFDGPFLSAEEASLDAIAIHGTGAPVMDASDAKYVHYDDARDFDMNA